MISKSVDYDGLRFVGVENYDVGDFTHDTVFDYHQVGDVVWGTYVGGGVQFGVFVAVVSGGGELEMCWSYISRRNQLRTGKCRSVPQELADGRLMLREHWVTEDGEAGESAIVQIRHFGLDVEVNK